MSISIAKTVSEAPIPEGPLRTLYSESILMPGSRSKISREQDSARALHSTRQTVVLLFRLRNRLGMAKLLPPYAVAQMSKGFSITKPASLIKGDKESSLFVRQSPASPSLGPCKKAYVIISSCQLPRHTSRVRYVS